MADFDVAFAQLLPDEGGFSKDPTDPGNWTGGEEGSGELKGTKYGVSAKSYPDLDIENLTLDEAKAIYLRDFWVFAGLQSQRIANKLFDEYVNSKHHAIRTAQLALSYLQVGPIVADGNYGPVTEAHLNAVDEQKFMDEFKARLCVMHCQDALANPAQAGDLLGWMRRDVRG